MLQVNQRNVPDTPKNRVLNAEESAMKLVIHTIKICTNRNIFLIEYQRALTDDIIKISKDIFLFIRTANQIRVEDKNGNIISKNYEARLSYQKQALINCNNLLGLIAIARSLFHLRGKKCKYWSQLVLETKNLTKKWHDSDISRYGM